MNEETKMILAEMKAMEDRLNARMDSMDARFETIDKRFESIDKRFDAVDKRFDGIEKEYVALTTYLGTKFAETNERIDALAAKLDDNQRITKLNTLDIASLRAKQA